MRGLERHMTDALYYATASEDMSGNPTLGTPTLFYGRVVARQRRVVDEQGQEVLSRATIQTYTAITSAHYLWLPGADQTNDNEAVRPLAIESAGSLSGGATLYQVSI